MLSPDAYASRGNGGVSPETSVAARC